MNLYTYSGSTGFSMAEAKIVYEYSNFFNYPNSKIVEIKNVVNSGKIMKIVFEHILDVAFAAFRPENIDVEIYSNSACDSKHLLYKICGLDFSAIVNSVSICDQIPFYVENTESKNSLYVRIVNNSRQAMLDGENMKIHFILAGTKV